MPATGANPAAAGVSAIWIDCCALPGHYLPANPYLAETKTDAIMFDARGFDVNAFAAISGALRGQNLVFTDPTAFAGCIPDPDYQRFRRIRIRRKR